MRPSRIRKAGLTELEGAILAAVRRAGSITPYKLRHAFLVSPSMEWSGSAGAVYPAMRRLKGGGLLTAKRSDDGRGTEHYSLTKKGGRALKPWAADMSRVVGAGSDPFRTRVPEWLMLAGGERARLLAKIERAVRARCRALKAEMAKHGRVERAQFALELDLQRARLRWIAAHKRA